MEISVVCPKGGSSSGEEDAHIKAARRAQQVFDIAQKLEAKGYDTTDAKEFLDETRFAMEKGNYKRALKMANLAQKTLDMVGGVDWDTDDTPVPEADPPPPPGISSPPNDLPAPPDEETPPAPPPREDMEAPPPPVDQEEWEEPPEDQFDPAETMEIQADVGATMEIGSMEPSGSGEGTISDYKIGKRLGSGGFADVYLATDSRGIEVALKRPKASTFEDLDDKHKDAFIEEAEHWAKLYNYKDVKKGIVGIYSYAKDPEPYIAMEYMSGGSLRNNMKDMQNEEKLRVLERVLDTLYIVHHLGIIHRDIKPENVLLNMRGQWKLADWGLAKVMLDSSGTTTQAGTIKATLAYASPEQIESDDFGDVDWRTDIYQVGAMAYEMFTGQRPFDGEPARIIYQIVSKNPKHPCEVNKNLDQELGDTILKALEKDKMERWQDAIVFKRALMGEAHSGTKKQKNKNGGVFSSIGKGIGGAMSSAKEKMGETKENMEARKKAAEQKKHRDNVNTYGEVIYESLRDGKISRDEERMLKKMRQNLGVSDDEHMELMDRIKKEVEADLAEIQETDGYVREEKPPKCPKCQVPSVYVPQYKKWYCYTCYNYVPDNVAKIPTCSKCGTKAEWIKEYRRYFCYKCNDYILREQTKIAGNKGSDVLCPTCGKPSTYIKQYDSHYCYDCQQYTSLAGGASAACPRCGNPPTWVPQYSRYFCEYCQQYL